MRLIDADKYHEALVKLFEVKNEKIPPIGFLMADSLLDEQPTVKEPKGEWVRYNKYLLCSECHCREDSYTNFCSWCGADMRRNDNEIN